MSILVFSFTPRSIVPVKPYSYYPPVNGCTHVGALFRPFNILLHGTANELDECFFLSNIVALERAWWKHIFSRGRILQYTKKNFTTKNFLHFRKMTKLHVTSTIYFLTIWKFSTKFRALANICQKIINFGWRNRLSYQFRKCFLLCCRIYFEKCLQCIIMRIRISECWDVASLFMNMWILTFLWNVNYNFRCTESFNLGFFLFLFLLYIFCFITKGVF